MDLAGRRTDYAKANLDESDLGADPIAQLGAWLEQAEQAELPEPNAMTLCTVASTGAPSARVVLLRGLDDRGLAFYTNYTSRKGRELAANQQVSLVFFWPQLERQVRVEGVASRV
ncbi:MAG: pyridoxal 5'-phosphate synthase, partial [Planctomycetota bacterium]